MAAARDYSQLRYLLLRHYDVNRRKLPWRGERDPYRVWVSEVMLQQTRVQTVIPYYSRWMERFPDLVTLADSEQDDVLELWRGLGYYTRARNLHRGAVLVRDRYDGRLPAQPAELMRIPGVGRYTAGALASIAFGVPVPAVDGNTRRVLCRLFDLPSPSASRLAKVADAVIDPDRPGDFNQAIMDVGATVCTPRAPGCSSCPLQPVCLAAARGTAESRPVRTPRKRPPERSFAVAVLVDERGRALLVRRPEQGLLAGLWAFPEAELRTGASAAKAARRVAGSLGHSVSGRARRLDEVPHTFTHMRARYLPVLLRTRAVGERDLVDQRWVNPADLGTLAVPNAQKRIAQHAAHALACVVAETNRIAEPTQPLEGVAR